MIIKLASAQDPALQQLLRQHREEMSFYSPPESIHAVDMDSDQAEALTFFACWIDQQLAGCGGIQVFNEASCEIKAMRTVKSFLRQGVANGILQALMRQAERWQCRSIYLETGSHQAFLPARKLYEANGFEYCDPFNGYQPDPHSYFMKKSIPLRTAPIEKDQIAGEN